MRKIFPLLILVTLLCSSSVVSAQAVPDYRGRQQVFMERIGSGLALVYASTPRGALNKNFYYLTGENDLSMVLMLCPDCSEKTLLFSENLSSGLIPLNELGDRVAQPLNESGILWVSAEDSERTIDIRNRFVIEEGIRKTDLIFYQLREIKDETELEFLKKAVSITSDAYHSTLQTLRPGLTEMEVINAFKKRQIDLGAESTSFIQAGSGPNGTQVHATPTERVIEKGDLVVFDVGAWYNSYTSDISRTFPASGKFTKPQKKIYQLVLDAQKAAIERMVPGAVMRDVQRVTEDILIEGLFRLGLITDVNSAWQRSLYIVHGYYHYIGLDVHDLYPVMSRETATKTYQPGMVMTMEPGLYFPPGYLDKKPPRARNISDEEFRSFVNATSKNYRKYSGIGVRIEDDILITSQGNVNLSQDVPKEIRDIEKVMKQVRKR
jgi:Xaa-Pro aminopeptidase